MISTRNLGLLPEPVTLRRLLQSIALLDAIICPEWEYRYYSFNSAWAPGQQMGSMRSGSGDEFFAHFSAAGCWLKGFDHESPMTPYRLDPPQVWRGVLDSVPDEFAPCLREPAFSLDATTFCLWRTPSATRWSVGPVRFPSGDPDPDGSERLLEILDGRPESYREWASEYYEREIPLTAVRHIYKGLPISKSVVEQLNPELSLKELKSDLKEIGYGRSD